MRMKQRIKNQWAVCVRTNDPGLLTPRRIYEVLPDKSARKSDYLRVIDNEGEDYLYPAAYFVRVNFSPQIRQAIAQAS